MNQLTNSDATRAIYKKIVEDVIKNVKKDFDAAGYDPSTLLNLKDNWLSKLQQDEDAEREQKEQEQAGGGTWVAGNGAPQPMESQPGEAYRPHSNVPANWGHPAMSGATMVRSPFYPGPVLGFVLSSPGALSNSFSLLACFPSTSNQNRRSTKTILSRRSVPRNLCTRVDRSDPERC